MRYLNVYLEAINVLTFVIYGIDKYKAKHSKWRISENMLMVLALMGGSVGALFGMYGFRHKTRKVKFNVGIPCILIVQVLLWMYLH